MEAQMQPSAKASRWISQVKGLVSPPDICITVFDMIETQTTTARQLGDVIGRDPNLTARLLKIVNSPYYNFSSRIDTISRAITIIGIRELSSLVVAVSAVKTFSKIPNELVNIDTFWRHSIYTALIARELAKRCDVLHPERLFVAGLMHDIGSLIIYNRVPDVARALLIQANGSESALYELEKNMIGITHAHIGGLLLEAWMLPKVLRDAVAYHHEPHLTETAPIEASIVHIAETLANMSLIGSFSAEICSEENISPQAWKILRIDPEKINIETLMRVAEQQFSEVRGSIFG